MYNGCGRSNNTHVSMSTALNCVSAVAGLSHTTFLVLVVALTVSGLVWQGRQADLLAKPGERVARASSGLVVGK